MSVNVVVRGRSVGEWGGVGLSVGKCGGVGGENPFERQMSGG